jgi:hypothetical protein
MEDQMNIMRSLPLLIAVITLGGFAACNYSADCWYYGEGSENAGAGPGAGPGGGIIIPTGPSGVGGYGDTPPDGPQEPKLKCNDDEDEDENAEEGSPESTSSNGPSGVPIGSFSPSDFKFVTVIPDDGEGESGGWQQAKAVLKIRRLVGLTYETFSCPQMTIGTPLRNKKQGKISAEMAAEISAEIATYVTGIIDQVPQGIFCVKLKDGMTKMIPQAISGAKVTQP